MTQDDASLPIAGWYPDPENSSGPRRWWDGRAWTDIYQTTPPAAPTVPQATAGYSQQPQQQQAPHQPAGQPQSSVSQHTPAQPTAQPLEPGTQPQVPGSYQAPAQGPTQYQSGAQPQYPGAAQPQYPGAAQPQYPGAAQPQGAVQPQGAALPSADVPPMPQPGIYHGAVAAPSPYPVTAPAQQRDGFPGLGQTISAGFGFMTAYWKPLLVIVSLCMVLPLMIQFASFAPMLDFYVPLVTGEGSAKVGAGLVFGVLGSLIASYLLTLGVEAAAILSLRDRGEAAADRSFAAAVPALRSGVGRGFVLFGWTVLISIVVSIIWTLLSLLLALAGIPILVLFFGLILVVLWAIVSVKWAYLPQAIADGHNVPFAPSGRVSQGRFWRVLGQLVVVGILFVSLPNLVASGLNAIGFAIGGKRSYTLPIETVFDIEQMTITVPSPGAGLLSGLLVGFVMGFAVLGCLVGALTRMYRSAPNTPS